MFNSKVSNSPHLPGAPLQMLTNCDCVGTGVHFDVAVWCADAHVYICFYVYDCGHTGVPRKCKKYTSKNTSSLSVEVLIRVTEGFNLKLDVIMQICRSPIGHPGPVSLCKPPSLTFCMTQQLSAYQGPPGCPDRR